MYRRTLLVLACTIALPALAAPPHDNFVGERRVVLRGANGGHTFIVELARQPFRKAQHKIERRNDYPEDKNSFIVGRIDGSDEACVPVGLPDYLPRQELCVFTVVVDGKPWLVPPRLWHDVFDPVLSRNPHFRPTSAAVSKDGTRLWVRVHGSDGIASYRAIWNLRANGRHIRKVMYTEL